MGKRFILSEEAKPSAKQHTAPCSDCPWSRKSYPGWLGPNTVQEWLRCAHSDERINCHTRTDKSGEPWQCAGAATYRTHICKSPRDPEILELPPIAVVPRRMCTRFRPNLKGNDQMDKHLFTLPMDNQGLCGRCGKSCIDEIHISSDEYIALLKESEKERQANKSSGKE